jgi:hypothetical protein
MRGERRSASATGKDAAVNTDNTAMAERALEQELERCHTESTRWRHRFLAIFFTETTRNILRFIAAGPPMTKDVFYDIASEYFKNSGYIVPNVTNPRDMDISNFPGERSMTDMAINPLLKYKND